MDYKQYDVSLLLEEDTLSLFEKFLDSLGKDNSRRTYSLAVGRICSATHKDFLKLNAHEVDMFFSSLKLKKATVCAYFYCCHSFASFLEERLGNYSSPFVSYAFHSPAADYTTDDFPPLETLKELLVRAEYGSDLYLAICLALTLCLTVSEIAGLIPQNFLQDDSCSFCLVLKRREGSEPSVLVVPSFLHDMILTRQNRGHLLLNCYHKPVSDRTLRGWLAKITDEWTFRKIRCFGILLLRDAGLSEMDVASFCGISGQWLHRYRGVLEKKDYSSAAASLFQTTD